MQLVIISGKGGTGKTTVAASFSYLSEKSIKVDCDVDASNLNIIVQGKDIEENSFIGAKVTHIDPEECVKCGECQKVCRYDAISSFVVDELRCEGCAACTVVCKYDAINLRDEVTGKTVVTDTNNGILSRAEMEIGAEGSGKLVTEVRKNALRYKKNNELVILDGSPGVGCSVMASITGCDVALIVVEPTQSGLEDFQRVLSVTNFFDVRPFVCINKYDINEEITNEIELFCQNEGINIVGRMPFDDSVKKAINELKPIVSYNDSIAGQEIKFMWKKLNEILQEEF